MVELSPEIIEAMRAIGIGVSALSVPIGVNKLIKTVSPAIGWIAEPYQLKRMKAAEAKGDVAADRIRKLGELETANLVEIKRSELTEAETGLIERAKNRENYAGMRQQQNVENVTKLAAELIPESVSEEPVSEDWVFDFFDHCKSVSDEQMQILWAKILAGEVADPGAYSPRTLQTLKLMTKDDAEIFSIFCNYIWAFNLNTNSFFYISTSLTDSYLHPELTHLDFLHLESIGLLLTKSGMSLENFSYDAMKAFYGERHFMFRPYLHPTTVLHTYSLSIVGNELARLRDFHPDEEYLSWLKKSEPSVDFQMHELEH